MAAPHPHQDRASIAAISSDLLRSAIYTPARSNDLAVRMGKITGEKNPAIREQELGKIAPNLVERT